MNDKEYWSNYYNENQMPTEPSTFAKFILPKLEEGKNLIELGCGNGRDSIYFSKNKIKVHAIDQVKNEVDFLNENFSDENITFIADDFTNLANTNNELIKNTTYDYIYSRFTFHSINEKKEDNALSWSRS